MRKFRRGRGLFLRGIVEGAGIKVLLFCVMTNQFAVSDIDKALGTIGLFPRNPKQSLRSPNLWWEGKSGDREIQLLLSRRTKTKYYSEDVKGRVYTGHRVVIEIPLTICTRFSILKRQANSKFTKYLFGLVSLKPFWNSNVEYEPFALYASEPAWAQQFTSDVEVLKIFHSGMFSINEVTSPSFTIGPNVATMTGTVHISHFCGDIPSRLVRYAIALAEAAERYTPQVKSEFTPWERFLRKNPVLVILAFVVAFILFALAVTVLLVFISLSKYAIFIMMTLVGLSYMTYKRYLK